MRISHNRNGWNGNDTEWECYRMGMITWECYRMGVDRIRMLQNGNDNIQNGNDTEWGWMEWK